MFDHEPHQQQLGAAPAVAAAATTTLAVAAGASAATTAAAKGVSCCTSVEFEAAWRGMVGDLRRQAAYLSAIPPASLPTVFKNSLTAPVLASLPCWCGGASLHRHAHSACMMPGFWSPNTLAWA
ncbi:hypothetical protein PLESTB_000122600 [Pleodorina starrii]|uniref:RNA-polymerase II-associated protein 3-like C-terminal domain-containing protein n=1 Tax=Pleodorina starrii TaxID=330485 RepID=A0A9W6EY35_9CHLO|nr:hypothetical protein PLESTB_000122600 [Pleodorina starrii]